MKNVVTVFPLAAAILVFQSITAIADEMPKFSVGKICLAAANKDQCLRDEQGAEAQLVAQWPQFAAADRATCSKTAEIGGMPSYVELLTCLQLARNVKNLPKDALPRGDTAPVPRISN